MIASSALRKYDLVGRQEEVFRQLLTDGRTAGDETPPLLVLFQRFLDTFPVEAFMIDELGIFGSDDGPLQMDGNALIGHPLLFELGIGNCFWRSSASRISMKRVVAGIDPAPQQHPAKQPQLPDQEQPEHKQQGPLEPVTDRLSSRQSGAQFGEYRRGLRAHAAPDEESLRRLLDQHANPSARCAAPCSAACRAKGVSPFPYIMS
jgi:hypothetical protein